MNHFDAHNHLQHVWLAPHLPQILDDLNRLGIAGAVVNGTLDSDWLEVARLASENPWVIPSYGVHPWYAAQRAPDWEQRLVSFLDNGGIVGEIGLDRWREGLDFEDQLKLFTAQLHIAAQRDLPVTIHCLRAWGPLWDIIRTEQIPASGFLLHAYGGPVEMVDGFVKRGARFSFNGAFLAQGKEKKLQPFRHIPLDRLLVETDAPAMPVPSTMERCHLPGTAEGGRINHPGNIAVAYNGLATLRGMPGTELAGLVQENFQQLFRPR